MTKDQLLKECAFHVERALDDGHNHFSIAITRRPEYPDEWLSMEINGVYQNGQAYKYSWSAIPVEGIEKAKVFL